MTVIITDEIIWELKGVSNLQKEIVEQLADYGVKAIKDFTEIPNHKYAFNNTYLAITNKGEGIPFTCPKQCIVSFLKKILDKKHTSKNEN